MYVYIRLYWHLFEQKHYLENLRFFLLTNEVYARQTINKTKSQYRKWVEVNCIYFYVTIIHKVVIA